MVVSGSANWRAPAISSTITPTPQRRLDNFAPIAAVAGPRLQQTTRHPEGRAQRGVSKDAPQGK
jgi:hypothetical protein